MKTKYFFAMAVMLLSLCGLASCVSETETVGNGEDTAVTRSIVFNISLPTGDPVHVKTRTAIQDAAEYDIKSLHLLVFDAATDKLKSINAVNLTDDVTSVGFGTGDDYKYTYTWDPTTDGTTCRFLMVANEDVANIAAIAVNNTWDQVLAAVSSASRTLTADASLATVFDEDTKGLPMTGVAYYNVGTAKNEIIPLDKSSASAITVNVDLTRVVARIDVYNKTPNLFITGIKLVHANPQSYLTPHKDGSDITDIPTSMTKVGGATGGLGLYNNVWDTTNSYEVGATNPMTGSSTDDGTPLHKAFYCYEDEVYTNADAAALEAEALAIQVTGRIGTSYNAGVDVFYQIPFTDAYLATPVADNKSVEIKRNYLYKVIIGDGSEVSVNSRIRATLTVADWDATAVPTTFEDALFYSAPIAAVGTYNRDTRLITLASNAAVTSDGSANDLTIKVTDTYSSSVNITGVEVLTTGSTWKAHDDAGGTGWLTAAFTSAKTVTLTATANDSGAARIGSVRITYSYVDGSDNIQTDAKIVFSVMQPAS